MDHKAEERRKQRHSLTLLEQVQRMKESAEIIDVVLVAEGEKFPCHRVVLAAFSAYFRAMFTCGLAECAQREVVLQDTCAESVAVLLHYMYSAELRLSSHNVQPVALTACFMQMEEVCSMCQKYMMDHMDASNCVGIYYFASHIGAEDLCDQARKYVYQHFAEVSLQEEILEVEFQQLMTLIKSDDLNISREESILDLVIRWVKHSRETRSEHLIELLKQVRLVLISPSFLVEARKRNTMILCNSECNDLFEEALKTIQLSRPPSLSLRYGMETTDLLLCIGNNSLGIRSRHGSYADASFCFAPATRKTYFISSPKYHQRGNHFWHSLCTTQLRELYALGTAHNDLYVIGGQMKVKNQYLVTNCVEKYSMEQGSWRSTAPLPVPLACHVVVTVKDKLYVLGGWTPQMDLPDEEPDRLSNRTFRYDPAQDKWAERAPMKFSKYRFSTAVVNGEIYVLGGIGCLGYDRGQTRKCLDAVEIYNPDGDFWRDGPPLPSPLLSLRTNSTSAGSVEGKLYLCGGFHGAARHEVITKEILELDTWENQWNVVATNVLMHDSYDVCLVARLNPRDLIPPPPDLVDQ
ncbi:PREDICTED: kelch repeat and BTB domain-containing protein 12 isoform X2 [Ficedula albicollis]|uniref:kelch repeat and BTB domain-containing protein 12 isoform X2 n=1 Tax=Ficedula albicollis TaxID=59894 RepID=UPI0007AD7D64|nr:PREDICTED: kelch repeat and BTB domain-containing protein 12 isoform X2 [Ficedula albicollis]